MLQLNRDTPIFNADISSALNVEELTDNNTLMHLQSYHPNRAIGTRAIPISNSRVEINDSDFTINHRGQQNFFYPADIKFNENQLQTFILSSKCNRQENSWQMKNHMQNELSDCVDQKDVAEDTRICRIYCPEENDRPAKKIPDVFQIGESTTDSFENMLTTQNQTYGVIRETSLSAPLQHTVVQKSPLQDCRTGRGTELSNEGQLILSYDVFDASDNSVLDEAASDKLQRRDNQTAIIDAAPSKVVTQGPKYFMEFPDSNSIMEDNCYRGDELREKFPSQNNFTTIEPFMAVTIPDKGQGACVSLQDVNCSEDVGTGNIDVTIPENESQERSRKDVRASTHSLLYKAESKSNSSTTLEKTLHNSHKTVQRNTYASSKELKTSYQSHYKKILSPNGKHSNKATCFEKNEHKNMFVKGRHVSIKGKLEVPGAFQKRRKTKNKPCSDQQIAYSEVNLNGSETEISTKNIEDVTSGTFIASGRNKRKVFQTPFKKMSSQANQVHKLTYFFILVHLLLMLLSHFQFLGLNSLCSCINNFFLDSAYLPIAMDGLPNRRVQCY
jgi:hypothetical protein